MNEKKPVEIAPQVIKFKGPEIDRVLGFVATLLMTKREEGDPRGEWRYVVELKEYGEVTICLPCTAYEGALILAGVLNTVLQATRDKKEIK